MKNKLSKIMRSGGYAVIIAAVAMAAYLAIIRWGDRFMENQTVPLVISIDEDGYLSTNYGGDTKGVYIIWETDGGNIKPVEENEELSGQYEEGNKWYFAYTGPNEKVKWDSLDADGNNYIEASVRATVYQADSSESIFYIYEYINEVTVTVKKNGDTVALAENNRLFTNPVREGETSWSQIYQVSAAEDGTKTYFYRTGETIENPDKMILVWESNQEVMNVTALRGGTVGNFSIDAENTGKNIVAASSSITINPENIKDGFVLQAYLTDIGNVEKESGEILETEKNNIAAIEITK